MRILVTGASGVLGRRVARLGAEKGHDVVRASRVARDEPGWVTCDLVTGSGLPRAVEGVDAVVHCASDARNHRRVDVDGTAALLAAAPDVPIAYPGIVGSDVIPTPYYRSKQAAEALLERSSTPHAIQRFTQFHQLIWMRVVRRSRYPVVPAAKGTRFQVLDPGAAAASLISALEEGASGHLPDLGGPRAYEAEDLARSVLTAVGTRRPVITFNRPGIVGAAFRAGGNLTPNRDETGITWNEFVAGRLAQA